MPPQISPGQLQKEVVAQNTSWRRRKCPALIADVLVHIYLLLQVEYICSDTFTRRNPHWQQSLARLVCKTLAATWMKANSPFIHMTCSLTEISYVLRGTDKRKEEYCVTGILDVVFLRVICLDLLRCGSQAYCNVSPDERLGGTIELLLWFSSAEQPTSKLMILLLYLFFCQALRVAQCRAFERLRIRERVVTSDPWCGGIRVLGHQRFPQKLSWLFCNRSSYVLRWVLGGHEYSTTHAYCCHFRHRDLCCQVQHFSRWILSRYYQGQSPFSEHFDIHWSLIRLITFRFFFTPVRLTMLPFPWSFTAFHF